MGAAASDAAPEESKQPSDGPQSPGPAGDAAAAGSPSSPATSPARSPARDSPRKTPIAGRRRDTPSASPQPMPSPPTPALTVSGFPADMTHTFGATPVDDDLLSAYLVLADAVALFLTGSAEPCVVIDYVEIQKWGTNDDLLSLYFLRKGVDEEPCELLLYTLDAAEISAALADTLHKLYPDTPLLTSGDANVHAAGSTSESGGGAGAEAGDADDDDASEAGSKADDGDGNDDGDDGDGDGADSAAERAGAGVEESKAAEGDVDDRAHAKDDDEIEVEIKRFLCEVVSKATPFNTSISLPVDEDMSIIVGLDGMSFARAGCPDEIWHLPLPEIRSWHHSGDDQSKPDMFSMSLVWEDPTPIRLSLRTRRAREISASLSMFIAETLVLQEGENGKVAAEGMPAPPAESPPPTPPAAASRDTDTAAAGAGSGAGAAAGSDDGTADEDQGSSAGEGDEEEEDRDGEGEEDDDEDADEDDEEDTDGDDVKEAE